MNTCSKLAVFSPYAFVEVQCWMTKMPRVAFTAPCFQAVIPSFPAAHTIHRTQYTPISTIVLPEKHTHMHAMFCSPWSIRAWHITSVLYYRFFPLITSCYEAWTRQVSLELVRRITVSGSPAPRWHLPPFILSCRKVEGEAWRGRHPGQLLSERDQMEQWWPCFFLSKCAVNKWAWSNLEG